jgi:cytidine deaminase
MPRAALSESTIQDLLGRASRACLKSYAPYSNFNVGAALLTDNGEVYEGCNIENASYPISVCAERGACASAIVQGAKILSKYGSRSSYIDGKNQVIACAVFAYRGSVVDGSPSYEMVNHVLPCGMCRQFLFEFNPNMQIIVTSPDNSHEQTETKFSYKTYKLSSLLPLAFGPGSLNKL